MKVCRSGYIWLHKDDPLAEKDELEFADLSGRSVILPLGSRYKAFSDAMKAAIEEAGAAAEFIYKPGSLTEVALSIAYDELALISGCDIDDYRFAVVPDRVFRPVAPSCNELGFYALFLRGNDNPALSAFLDFAVEQGV